MGGLFLTVRDLQSQGTERYRQTTDNWPAEVYNRAMTFPLGQLLVAWQGVVDCEYDVADVQCVAPPLGLPPVLQQVLFQPPLPKEIDESLAASPLSTQVQVVVGEGAMLYCQTRAAQ